MHFSKFHPLNNYAAIADRWKTEARAEKKKTAQEKEDFRLSSLSYREDTIEMRRAITASHQALIAETGAVLEAAMKKNGFTDRFRISIKGDR